MRVPFFLEKNGGYALATVNTRSKTALTNPLRIKVKSTPPIPMGDVLFYPVLRQLRRAVTLLPYREAVCEKT